MPNIDLKNSFVLCALITCLPMLSIAQSAVNPDSNNQSAYIAHFDTLINLKVDFHSDYERFYQDDGKGYEVDVRPNVSVSNRFSFSYRFIAFGFSVSPKFYPGNNDEDLQGKTEGFGFGFGFSNKLIQHLSLDYKKGFYLHNTPDLMPNWQEGKDPYIQLPDIKMVYLRGLTGYRFNTNYSLNAIHSQTQAQLRSAGSLIPILSYDYYAIDNQSDETPSANSQLTRNLRVIANLGYGYTYVFAKKFYLSVHLAPGIGYQHTWLLSRLQGDEVKSQLNNLVLRLQEQVGAGFQGNRFFAGAEINLYQMKQTQKNTSMQLQTKGVYFQVFAGYRLKAPAIIKKTVDQTKGLAPEKIQKMIE